MMRTQVAIIGAGPAGLLLSHILHLRGISSVILEARSQSYCEARIRAGILEQGTVDILRAAGMGARMDHEGLPHHGIDIAFDGGIHPISIEKYDGGRQVMAYGQTEIVKDLFRQHEDNGTVILTAAKVTEIRDIDGVSPQVHYHHNGKDHVLACDFVAGCDGFRGVSRNAMPASIRNDFDLIYPYSWLGILAKAPPMNKVVIYAQHPRGFALQSMRSNEISRLYIQVDNDDHVDNWSDEALWDELDTRIGVKQNRGDIIQKGITPMRSFVSEPMSSGRLFMAGDAGHIVPPTGAKGLNLAIADVALLSAAFIDFYCDESEVQLQEYSSRALRRVWKVERFSWFCTTLLHTDHRHSDFEKKLQRADMDYLLSSDAAMKSFAENYAGLPIEILPDL